VALRITTTIENGTVVLRLHGWLVGAEVGAFEEAWNGVALPARIDLRWLVGADGDGIRALRQSSELGAQLTGASPYLELLMRGAEA